MTRRHALWAGTAAATVVIVLLVGLSIPSVRSLGAKLLDSFGAAGPTAAPVAVEGADRSGSGPGSLVSATTMPGLLREAGAHRVRAARVVYRSTSGDGQPTVVSGSALVPGGDPPAGGWPVISYGHGTTGIDEPCAPSLSDTLLGQAAAVIAIVEKGYAVALADFQGLGMPGIHPYTDARTAGLNMIDAVRALRATFGSVSTRWGAYGASQGGGAAWAADEQARTYAPELDFVGAVAIAPAADVTGLVSKSQDGTLTEAQEPALPVIVESLARLHPDLNRDDYRRGSAARDWEYLVACSGPNVHKRGAALGRLKPTDIAPATPAAADRLRRYLAQWALPQQQLSAPLLVWYGGVDTLIDASWTARAIQRACALGGTVAVEFAADKGHGNADYFALLQWLTDRFAGQEVVSACA